MKYRIIRLEADGIPTVVRITLVTYNLGTQIRISHFIWDHSLLGRLKRIKEDGTEVEIEDVLSWFEKPPKPEGPENQQY